MIAGIGIDMIAIDRFAQWHTYSYQQLSKIFSDHEIAYSMQDLGLSSARFAARFAAKEAFFKSWCAATTTTNAPLSAVCTLVWVQQQEQRAPELIVDWPAINALWRQQQTSRYHPHLSLTHTDQIAGAYVILEKIEE